MYPFFEIDESVSFPPPDYVSMYFGNGEEENAVGSLPSQQGFFAEGGKVEVEIPQRKTWGEDEARLAAMLQREEMPEEVIEQDYYPQEELERYDIPKEVEDYQDYRGEETVDLKVDQENYDKLSFKQALKKAQMRSDVYNAFEWRGELYRL